MRIIKGGIPKVCKTTGGFFMEDIYVCSLTAFLIFIGQRTINEGDLAMFCKADDVQIRKATFKRLTYMAEED